MKKRMLVIAAAVAATSMMVASPVMAEDFKVGICNYVDDASLNQIVDNIQSRLEEIGKEKHLMYLMITAMQMPALWNRSSPISRQITLT